jgi:hypothetical protein
MSARNVSLFQREAMFGEGRPEVIIGLNAVIITVAEDEPRILVVRRADHALAVDMPSRGIAEEPQDALPFGPFDPQRHRTLDLGVREWVETQTGLSLGYVEQLYTFADQYRDPRELAGGGRVASIGYLALVNQGTPGGSGDATWRSWHDYMPWEDWRDGRPAVLDEEILPGLERWIEAAPDAGHRTARLDRVAITFGTAAGAWDAERVLDRYQLLYEAGVVAEARRDRAARIALGGASQDLSEQPAQTEPGRSMALDHRRILATAMSRIRGKLKYRPVVFELLPAAFTLLHMQRVVEALSGVRLHKQNFRRLVIGSGLVDDTGRVEARTGGRPAALFRFRREVLRERPAPGVGLPALRGT